jgi:DNA-3-methyladenine glycosylase
METTPPMPPALPRCFYARPAIDVALGLLGSLLQHQTPQGEISGEIVEVEAYLGEEDPACHAYRGKTARTGVFWQKPGTAYVYLVYGLHHCLNVVTRWGDAVGCVLIRAVEPVSGVGLMTQNRQRSEILSLASGPGRLTQAFGISSVQNGVDLTRGKLVIVTGEMPSRIAVTPRIGITKARNAPLRFIAEGNPYVSRTSLPVLFAGSRDEVSAAFLEGRLRISFTGGMEHRV